ncbi:MAG: hypothetical protein IIB46_03905, partial [Nitrospinae bacterium]|nr:hypothetical protein [Nitrospinota bacterium]
HLVFFTKDQTVYADGLVRLRLPGVFLRAKTIYYDMQNAVGSGEDVQKQLLDIMARNVMEQYRRILGSEVKPPDRIAAANITRFRRMIEFEYGVILADHAALYQWSVENIEAFWVSVWRFGEVVSSQVWDEVLVHGERMPGASWFPGARLNFAENLLRRRDDADALVFRGESGVVRRLSFAQLHDRVARLSAALRADGIVAGDRVVGFMPNLPGTVRGSMPDLLKGLRMWLES